MEVKDGFQHLTTPRNRGQSTFFGVWKMECITRECQIDKNTCVGLLELITQKMSLRIKPQTPLDPKPAFFLVINSRLVQGKLRGTWCQVIT